MAKPIEQTVPRHVAAIMDGNGRWAENRGLPRLAGHREGMESVRAVVRACVKAGVGYLTLYAFSLANWKRPAAEVTGLFDLLREFFERDVDEMHREGVRLIAIGRRERMPSDIAAMIEDGEKKTAANTRLTLLVALSYDGRDEIVRAATHFAEQVAAGDKKPDDLDEETFGGLLFTAGVPDPDLIIRTSGERRLSGFLLWQAAYAELYLTDILWPDFRERELEAALADFATRERRYGGLTETPTNDDPEGN